MSALDFNDKYFQIKSYKVKMDDSFESVTSDTDPVPEFEFVPEEKKFNLRVWMGEGAKRECSLKLKYTLLKGQNLPHVASLKGKT